MKTQIPHVVALGAALLLSASVPATAANTTDGKASSAQSTPRTGPNADPDDQKTDVPAPPMLLLLGIGAAGVIWGRRLSAKANANKS